MVIGPDLHPATRSGVDLKVLQRSDRPAPVLLLLVHGLGGGLRTWGDLPALLLSRGDPIVDVGIYDYTSGLRRFGVSLAASATTVVRQLADELTALSYASVIVVGHSMGGVIAQDVVRQLHSSEFPPYGRTRKVIGLILLAAPRAGSTRVPRWLYTKDARYLRAHSEVAVAIERFFHQHVATECVDHEPEPKLPIPVFAAVASNDRWVSEFSAGFGIPASQVRRFSRTHSSLVNVVDANDPVFTWLCEQISRILEAGRLRAVAASTETTQGLVVVQFSGHALEPTWDTAYLQALAAVNSTSAMRVLDARSSVTDVSLAVTIRAIRLSDVHTGIVRNDLKGDDARQRTSGRLSLAIAVVGTTDPEIIDGVYELVGTGPTGTTRWIVGVADAAALRSTIHRWVFATVDRLSIGIDAHRFQDDVRNDAITSQEIAQRGSLGEFKPGPRAMKGS